MFKNSAGADFIETDVRFTSDGALVCSHDPDLKRVSGDPRELAKWWGPEGFTAPSLEFNPRVADSYRIEMQPPEGAPFRLRGEYREVNAPQLAQILFVEHPSRARRAPARKAA